MRCLWLPLLLAAAAAAAAAAHAQPAHPAVNGVVQWAASMLDRQAVAAEPAPEPEPHKPAANPRMTDACKGALTATLEDLLKNPEGCRASEGFASWGKSGREPDCHSAAATHIIGH